ncbi:MAG: AsmA family protein [Oligoflexia bacterium]|nr:AsmA family protein [Oligoflexia bacterium]
MKLTKTKIFKYIALLILSFFMIAVMAAGLFVYFFPKETFKSMAIEQARQIINRELSIGSISYSLKGVVLENIIIYDHEEEGKEITPGTKPVFARAEKIYLRFSLLDLLDKRLKFSFIFLENFKFTIAFDETGKTNIQKLVEELTKGNGESAVATSIRNIKLDNAALELKNAPEKLRPLEGVYYFNGRLYFDKSGTIEISESKLQLPEKRGTMYPELLVHTKAKEFLITGNVELDKASLLWVYQWKKSGPLAYHLITGTITELKISKRAVEGFVKASSTLTNSPNILFADGFCRVSIENRTILIANTKGKIENSTLWFNFLQFSFKGTRVKFDARNIDAHVTDVMPMLDFLPKKLFGKMIGDLSYHEGIFNTEARLINAGYDYRGKMVSGINTTITIKDNIFKKSDIEATIYGHPCSVSIASTDKSLDRIFCNVETEEFNFHLKENENPYADLNLYFPVDVTGRVTIKKLKYNKYLFSQLQVNYSLSNSELTINNFNTGFMDGEVKGNAVIDTSVKPVTAQTALTFSGIKVHELFADSRFKNRFYGVAEGKANIRLLLTEKIYDTIHGNAEFNMDKGKLSDTGIQNGLGVWLSELKYKLIDLEFNKIYGNLDIKGTNYIVNSFIFNSQNIRFNVKGSFNENLIANPLYINMEFSKYFIQDIARPLVAASGYNKYLKGNWYYIPFQVSGDLTKSKNIKKLY